MARDLVRQLDSSRPICYESGGALAEGTGRTELTDVICTMYPVVPRTLELATRADEDRPGMDSHNLEVDSYSFLLTILTMPFV
jgi:beta-galactosidase/beta-glucuronidase